MSVGCRTSHGVAWLLLSGLAWTGCGGLQTPSAPGADETVVLIGAGDIGVCGSGGSIATGRLLDGQPGTVFAAGDLAYPDGTAEEFQECYEPTWGRHKTRTRPAPGNHEYGSPDAAPYFAYFGPNAGPPGLGYYRYRTGAWQVYSLNSSLDPSRSATQSQWLRRELAAHASACSVAYFHHPLFSSGTHGLAPPAPGVRDLWVELHNAGTDIVISAHEHFYERFGLQTPDGRPDPEHGIRQFVVGTGGAPLAAAVRRIANSETILRNFGVLRLTLEPLSYRWDFMSAEGGVVLDSGTGPCHSPRP
jgi:hypothetical protein